MLKSGDIIKIKNYDEILKTLNIVFIFCKTTKNKKIKYRIGNIEFTKELN
jgi:hypothetical protein